MIKDNLNIAYDLSGNLLLTIPKSYIQNADQDTLLQSVERLLKSAKKKVAAQNNWKGDSAAEIVGIGESGVTNGSIDHDNVLYGPE
ncbi:MAG: hypothetical protein D3904_03075 [Candidatus Electrothrix sp. EH2]|nr:hypothetical protein [Candidatus Electrothrix sp. EH2]